MSPFQMTHHVLPTVCFKTAYGTHEPFNLKVNHFDVLSNVVVMFYLKKLATQLALQGFNRPPNNFVHFTATQTII